MRGKDINKWKINYEEIYLIHSYDTLNTKDEFPVIYDYLYQFKTQLDNRSDKGNNWYNLRPCSYDYLFEKEKIIYSIISPEPQFVLDNKNYYLLDSCFIMNSEKINLKYLLALLNSKLLFWYFKDICYSLNKKGFQYKKIFMNELPIKISKEYETCIIELVDNILFLNQNIISEINFFHNYLKNEFNLNKLSKKLNEFYNLSYEDFFKELKKQNKKMNNGTVNQELNNKFNSTKKKLNKMYLKNEKLNFQLNNFIYKIYNLSSDEINIIESEIK